MAELWLHNVRLCAFGSMEEALRAAANTRAVDVTISEPRRGEMWLHFKGGVYMIVGLGHRAEDWKRIVVYIDPKSPDDLHTRLLDEWMSLHHTGVIRFRKIANSTQEYQSIMENFENQK